MGFLRSFFGSALSHAIRDDKKEKQKLADWNALFSECMNMDIEFNNFLNSLGIEDGHVSRPELPDEGRAAVNAEKRKLESYRKKINEFVSIGGKASNIFSYEKIDEYLEKIKYLRANGYLDAQDDWIQMDIEMLRTLIPMDIEAKKIMNDALSQKAKIEQRQELVKSVGFDVDTLSGKDFETVCQALVEKMGFATQTTKTTGDGGIDIVAHNSQPLLSGKYIIQCKRYSGSVGEPILRDLYGVVTAERANKGILMTTGYFTKPAVSFAEDKPLELIDRSKLRDLMEIYLKDDNRLFSVTQNIQHTESSSSAQSSDNNRDNLSPAKRALNIPPEYECLRAYLEQEPEWYSYGENRVELSNFMTIDNYKEFAGWIDITKKDPGNIKAKCRAIEVLHDSILTRLRMGSRTIDEVHAASHLLRTLLFAVKKEEYRESDDERDQHLYYMLHIIEGETAFWLGNLEESINCWKCVLEDFDYLNNDNRKSCATKEALILSIWTCMNYLDLHEEFEIFGQKHRASIEAITNKYKKEAEKTVNDDDWLEMKWKDAAKKKYSIFANPKTARRIIAPSLTSLFDKESSTLLCEGDNTLLSTLSTGSVEGVEFDSNKNIYFLEGADNKYYESSGSRFLLVRGNEQI